jgi:putative RecB family exonuclease
MTLAILESNPANAVAAALTGRDYLSFTQISTFQSCPLRWYFQYVEARASERVGSGLAFGAAIHSALECHYRAALAGEPRPTLDTLLAAYGNAWAVQARTPLQFGKSETAESLRRLAGRLLGAFQASDLASADGEIIGVEEQLRYELIPGLPDLLARVDLIVRTADALLIRDFKTARARWNGAQLARSAPQLLIYGELATPLAEEFGDLPVKLEFVVLTKTQSPAVGVHPVEFDAHSLGRTRRVIQRVWSAMQTGHVYPNPSPMNCSACSFRRACRAWCG